ncbi:MAG TPA: pyridoxal-phosphate dependent enzyme [Candidatus Cybelea sp.]|nr:pyridoxal-phosphate dependent enzyme [Candidatus Cybelea sp.]
MAEPADWVAKSASAAIGQRSLGDATRCFPLYPPLLEGCPATSTPEMQYPLEIDYDYSRVPPSIFRQPPLPGLDRWAPLLPPLMPGLSLGEGGTPLFPAARIGRWIGLDGPLWLKDESRNPTWSHKDRLNHCVVSTALAVGARGIAVASSGNHGAAAAAYAGRAGLPCVVITSPEAQPAFRHLFAALGAHVVVVPGEQRWPVLNRFIAATGFMPASNLTRFHTGNPFGTEGYKTIAYEIFAALGGTMPATVVVPTGYGELLYGLAKGFRELVRFKLAARAPRIVAAEPGVRGPLAHALRRNAAAVEVSGPPSLAAGIACTVGGFRGIAALADGGSAFVFAETSLAEATTRLAHEGLWQEYSGAAGLAALFEAKQRGERIEEPVVAILTSSGLKEMPAAVGDLPYFDLASLDVLIDRLKAA